MVKMLGGREVPSGYYVLVKPASQLSSLQQIFAKLWLVLVLWSRMKEVALQLWTKVFAEILVRARVCVMLMHALRLLIRNFQRLVFRSHAFLPQSLLFLIRIILPQSLLFRASLYRGDIV